MIKKLHIAAGGLALLAAGCAAAPGSIEAAYVPEAQYDSWSCEQFAKVIGEIQPRLVSLTDAQRARHRQDVALGIIVGITPSMLDPQREREFDISQLRGSVATMRKVAGERGCEGLPAPIPQETVDEPPPPRRNDPRGQV
ncbi:MAG: hypothetical protein AB7L41_04590 [Flavobacteriaceae bacterium]